MDLVEIIELRKTKLEELRLVIQSGKDESRQLTEVEDNNVVVLQREIDGLDQEIENINNNNKRDNNKNMENFKELIVRSSDGTIQNMNLDVRTLGLSSSLDNVSVAGNIAEIGYVPFWQSMGVDYMPNLINSIKLPFYSTKTDALKVGEGVENQTNSAVSTITFQGARYTKTEKIGKELMAVGNEQALQAFINKMVVDVDRAITKDIYDTVVAGAGSVTGLTAYTTTNIDSLVSAVDGEVAILMPRGEFYKAKGVKADAGSGKFLAEKSSAYTGNMWDGTPLFYSQLFTGSTITAVDLAYVTVGTFLNEGKEIEITFLPIPSKGQVEVTVCRLANCALRTADAAKKAVIA